MHVSYDDFKWGMTREEIINKEKEINESGKRLKARAYLENGKIVIPLDVPTKGVVGVPINDRFIGSVIKHVEEAFKRNYIDALIFPDMGHSHFFILQEYYDKVIKPLAANEKDILYQKIFDHSDLKILYHTAEQLHMVDEDKKLIDDRMTQWRFYTRNLVGGTKNLGKMELIHAKDHTHNTAREYGKRYRYWGAGFNISISKNGCFPFERDGKTFYFDLSMKDLEYGESSQW